MIDTLDFVVRPLLGIAAVAYLGLAVRVTRSSPQQANSVIAFIFFLVGALVAGSAFSYGTTDPNIYGIGRILAFFASGFLPVAFYVIYREYTVGSPSAFFIALLSVVPIATTLLALTNSMHNIIWAVVETEAGIRFTDITEHYWFKRVHAPFMYGLIGFTIAALAARLPTIALAHRRTVLMLLGCTLLPFAVNVVNRVVGIGAPDFPFT
ncbi:MAG: hypothetical protein OER22_06160, partial [Gammaproteobacteria bacterium]|nr:hypothetical protein [Gammaproteobacteria bacterium]